MREDYLEQLDKMFPYGYVIIYTCNDEQIILSLYNPHKYEQIEKYHQAMKEVKG